MWKGWSHRNSKGSLARRWAGWPWWPRCLQILLKKKFKPQTLLAQGRSSSMEEIVWDQASECSTLTFGNIWAGFELSRCLLSKLSFTQEQKDSRIYRSNLRSRIHSATCLPSFLQTGWKRLSNHPNQTPALRGEKLLTKLSPFYQTWCGWADQWADELNPATVDEHMSARFIQFGVRRPSHPQKNQIS